jgi:GT2 family glycosyltransferase
MIWFFTPYAYDKRFFDAIDRYFSLVANPNDWVVIMDGDTAFLRSDFGNMIKNYVDKYPDTGLFTCYASRCHYHCQVPEGVDMQNDSILYHHRIAGVQASIFDNQVEELSRKIAGHLMVIRKSTWSRIRLDVRTTASDKYILGVDTRISQAIMNHGLKIRLMKAMYLLHYLRLSEGFDYKKHLQP